jgi:hypothetical protein
LSKNKGLRGWFRGAEDGMDLASGEAVPMEGLFPSPSAAQPPSSDGIVTPPRPEESINTLAIYESAGISREERDRVDRAATLLRALPQSTPAEVRREIVETSLRTFGVQTEKIVEAARRETAALETFITSNQKATDKLLDDARTRVAALEQEIVRVKQAAEQAAAVQHSRNRLAHAEMNVVQQVLGFFGTGSSEPSVDLDFEEPTQDRPSALATHPSPPPRRAATEPPVKPPPHPHD